MRAVQLEDYTRYRLFFTSSYHSEMPTQITWIVDRTSNQDGIISEQISIPVQFGLYFLNDAGCIGFSKYRYKQRHNLL